MSTYDDTLEQRMREWVDAETAPELYALEDGMVDAHYREAYRLGMGGRGAHALGFREGLRIGRWLKELELAKR